MAELTVEDRVFIQRARRQMRHGRIIGWIFIAVPILCWTLMALNASWVIQRLERIVRTPPSSLVPAVERINIENARLRALHTTTPLEENLAKRLISMHEAYVTNSVMTSLTFAAVGIKTLLLWLLRETPVLPKKQ